MAILIEIEFEVLHPLTSKK